MPFISQIPIYSWCFLAIAGFIAVMNFIALVYNSIYQGSTSFVLLVGFFFFILSTLGWNEPIYFWLLALLDIGTILGLYILPQLIIEILSQSIFTRYAIYANHEQQLTLYKTKQSQTFQWQWVADVPLDKQNEQNFLAGLGGDWETVNNQLYLKAYETTLATATITENKLKFNKIKSADYHSLENAVLWQKFKK